ncbi:hypothetical protein EIMP300_07990 [Escherichia coli]|uniref:5-amino-6-(5-phospho-D-ribitylamino)uracil phosphatase YigB n=1 Tax=Escherichia coli TaxID=562 RepID=A0A8S0FIE2_ECOLX|nr:hypothetical protein EIMP300_07990 [Escherichia coli]
MRFYRPLGRISALTFDLDDTLYDNRPVILRTEREALTFVQNYHPALRSFQNEDLQRLRQAVREAEPEIYHDVTRWRFRSIEQAMLDAGLRCRRSQCRRTCSNDQLCQMAQPDRRPAANPRHLKTAGEEMAAGGDHQR